MTAIPAPSAAPAPGRTALRVSLWTAQIVLAAMFGMAGMLKLFGDMPALGQQIPWTNDVPLALTRFIGASELLGAIGLVLPAITRIRPLLTAWAAAGLATVMVLATGFHLVRGEAPFVTMPIGLGLLAGFVAWGRFRAAPIQSR